MTSNKEQLLATWSLVTSQESNQTKLSYLLNVLDTHYDLLNKVEREPGLEAVLEQLLGRIVVAFADFSSLSGKRILDIACGSNSSQAPPTFPINTPLQTSTITNIIGDNYTALFEPWFCRILLALGAEPVGIDFGDLNGESFEHYHVDLTQIGALDFLPSHSFDAVQDSRLFGSPEFTALLPDRAERIQVAREIRKQEQRLLKKADGVLIHSDAAHLLEEQ